MIPQQQSERRLAVQDKFIIRPADCCLVVAVLCNFLILLGEPLKNEGIVSLGSQGLIFSLFGFAFFQLIIVIKGQNAKNAYSFLALIIAAGISALFSGPTAILSHLIPLICFFMLPVSLLLYKNVYNVSFIKKAIYRFNWIYTILWTLLSFSSLSHIFYGEYGKETIEALTLGYSNPNQTGIFLMISFIIAFSAYQRDIKKEYKAIYLIQSVWTFILVCQTQSRTCIIISIAIVLLWLFKKIDKVGKKFTVFCFLLPLLLAFLLLFGGEEIQDILIFGEEFDTGRVNLFNSIVVRLTPSTFLFGNFVGWIGGNLHNSYFTIFAIFGLVGLVVYIIFLWKIVKDYFTQIDKKSPSAMLAYVGILAVIVHGSTESTLLTAGMVYGSLVSLIFVLTLNEDKKE